MTEQDQDIEAIRAHRWRNHGGNFEDRCAKCLRFELARAEAALNQVRQQLAEAEEECQRLVIRLNEEIVRADAAEATLAEAEVERERLEKQAMSLSVDDMLKIGGATEGELESRVRWFNMLALLRVKLKKSEQQHAALRTALSAKEAEWREWKSECWNPTNPHAMTCQNVEQKPCENCAAIIQAKVDCADDLATLLRVTGPPREPEMMPREQRLGQAWVSKITNGDGPEVSANGGEPSPLPITQEEWLRRYRQRFMDVAGLSAEQAEDCANAVTFEEASDSYDDDPEGAADMEMSYWDGD